ncbi:MAG TPA: MaoC family dehydratase N-terminal domain-containing protein [Acidimicrobiales bacterium]|nr:MaoC family dehydratase N-terminal domain-containing protein [Acidimicrobiales bacterium]
MAVEKFYVEAGHIMMFARSIGDPNPIYDPLRTDPSEVIAPPTFVQASTQFDPDFRLRPKIGGEGWLGSGREPSGAAPSTGGGGGGGGGLHAEQHFEYHRPLRAGEVLSATTAPGATWEKQGRRGGKLLFSESVTEYRTADGELVVTARSIGVRTEKVVEN